MFNIYVNEYLHYDWIYLKNECWILTEEFLSLWNHTSISVFSHIHWSFTFFLLDKVKTTLLLLTHVHITKDYIPQRSLLIIEAPTHTHIYTSDFSRYVVPNIEEEKACTHTRKVNTPTRANAARENLYDYTQLFFFVAVCMCAHARSFSTNNIAAE
jgi:hypothetical protein